MNDIYLNITYLRTFYDFKTHLKLKLEIESGYPYIYQVTQI